MKQHVFTQDRIQLLGKLCFPLRSETADTRMGIFTIAAEVFQRLPEHIKNWRLQEMRSTNNTTRIRAVKEIIEYAIIQKKVNERYAEHLVNATWTLDDKECEEFMSFIFELFGVVEDLADVENY